MAPDTFTLEGQTERMVSAAENFEQGIAWHWNMSLKSLDNQMIGYVNFSQVYRGVSQSCMLGYALGQDAEGKGLMHEALRATINEVFSERGRLHRIQANVVPENARSLQVLERLGFLIEGTARDYLFIGGSWREHVMTALHNPLFTNEWF